MLSTGGEETGYSNNRLKTGLSGVSFSSSSSSSSKSSSTSSSSSPCQFLPSNFDFQKPKTMEEVWKDINLASLHDHPSSDQDISVSMPPRQQHLQNHHHPHQNPNFILQDFLASPFNKDPNPEIVSSRREPSRHATLPLPATVLSLNSGPVFEFLESSDPLLRPSSHLQNNRAVSNNLVPPSDCPFEALDSSASFGKKRAQETDSSSGDRRHKRMIKNRESAARSRARKQAYTNELELEVAHLMEENARLRRQQEQLCVAAAALPKKHNLHRTSTAPF